MQLFLEYFPLIVFFIINSIGGIYWATGLMFIFSITSILLLYKYLPQEDDESDSKIVTNEENNQASQYPR